MKSSKFESGASEPLGEGEEKKALINPENKGRVIIEMKEGAEKDTPGQLEGRYRLTKIAHLLLPNNVPDIYNAEESVDGKQTICAERISHSLGHVLLQKERRSGGDEDSARKRMVEEMDQGMVRLDLELERIGFGFNIDENVSNYTIDETGNVYYLETFKPWQVSPIKPDELEVLFSEEELRNAIGDIPDQEVRDECERHLERIIILFEEAKQNLQESYKASLVECGPYIEELETMISPFMEEEILATLRAIQIEEDARNSKERKSANQLLGSVLKKMDFLQKKTNITTGKRDELYKKFKTLSNAVGIINRGLVDHNR
jgi:hypothetical protein